jgi:hypothetical protein
MSAISEHTKFLEKEAKLIRDIEFIHKSISSLEATIVKLDGEASVLIEKLHEMQTKYYGEDE